VAHMYTKSTNNGHGQATTDNMYYECTHTNTTLNPPVLIVSTQSNRKSTLQQVYTYKCTQ